MVESTTPMLRTPTSRPGDKDRPLPVRTFVEAASMLLQDKIGLIWIEGEVSGLKRPASGHIYFDLADEGAKLAAVMWRSTAQRVKHKLADGQRVVVRGKPSIYAERGSFQLYVEAVEPAGAGAAALALEELKRRLAAEGLFDPARKRKLPFLPRKIGVVTSSSGAAIEDITRTIERRFPSYVLVSPTRVQGDGAAAEIAQAIARLCALPKGTIDVMIVGRGGGAQDDLSAFNDEAVVRAIAACEIPVISAVGHEIDTSLADLAADVRASTPTAAAELALPERAALRASVGELEHRLARALRQGVGRLRHELDRRHGRLMDPRRLLARERQRLDVAVSDAERHVRAKLERRRRRLQELETRLAGRDPRQRLAADRRTLDELAGRMREAVRVPIDRRRRAFQDAASRLDAMSPLRVLDRGYAIARTPDGRVVVDPAEVTAGDPLELRVARGVIPVRVEGGKP